MAIRLSALVTSATASRARLTVTGSPMSINSAKVSPSFNYNYHPKIDRFGTRSGIHPRRRHPRKRLEFIRLPFFKKVSDNDWYEPE